MSEHRIEKDSMGEMRVPARAYYGAQTQRAVENFPISGYRMPRRIIWALGMLKRGAAEVNLELGLLDEKLARAIVAAAGEVVEGKLDEHFPVDVFQTGSGTSSNMNANEVIANRAIEILGGSLGSKDPVHPNDHVNQGQSSNDIIPTAIHLAVLGSIREDLLPALGRLREVLESKAREFDEIVKIGRTHLQDATPIRLGQEFSGYARQIELAAARVERVCPSLGELALGGTAVGTGLNARPGFAAAVIERVASATGLELREAQNHFEAQGARDALVEASGALRSVAVSMTKVANDVRWLGSGPRCGIGELRLPAVQPGSSIMPGKVNPVIPEAVLMVCAQVVGNDATVALCGMSGNFDLNVMMPVMAHDLLESTRLLGSAADVFRTRCLEALEADEERCREMVEQSLAMCTALAPEIGYDAAADIAKEAFRTGCTVREVALERKALSPERLEEVLDPMGQTGPRSSGGR